MTAATLVAVFCAAAPEAAPTYTATPIGVIGSNGSTGNAIDAAGAVTGSILTAGNSTQRAYIYADGVRHDLGTLGGQGSVGNAINTTGQVAGAASTAAQEGHAFLYANGAMADLGTLGGTFSIAYGVNASGQVTGFAVTAPSAEPAAEHAFLYANGVMTDLGTLGGRYSHGYGINASGQVIGRYSSQVDPGFDPVDRAFLYSNGVMRDLGTLGGPSSAATAINDSGQITGQASIADDTVEHAFLYSDHVMHDLGAPGDGESLGAGINATGQVVGWYEPPFNGMGGIAERAFLYTDGTMYDLNSLVIGLADTLLLVANGINDNGKIVANGCSASTICQAFRLDPIPDGQTPPPVNMLVAIEFHYPAFDHYFITSDASEISALDSGMFPGWVRTGDAFNVYSNPSVGTASVCRFFSTSFAPKSSHFYTPDAGECSFVKGNGGWDFEGVAFAIPVPDQQGVCPLLTRPVYRLFNNGMGGAPNHRFTTDINVRAQMLAAGWMAEGQGIGVGFCSPQ